MNEDAVYSAFEGQYVKRANEYYVASESSRLFLDHVRRNSIRILGIEGFTITKRCIEPDVGIIADYSANEDIGKSIDWSHDFVRRYKGAVTHFNFVLDLSQSSRFPSRPGP